MIILRPSQGLLRYAKWLVESLILIVGLPRDRRKLPRTVSLALRLLPHRVMLGSRNRERKDATSQWTSSSLKELSDHTHGGIVEDSSEGKTYSPLTHRPG